MCYLCKWIFAFRCIKGEPAIEEYYEMYLEAERHNNEILGAVMQSSTAQHFLTPGRVVVVKSQSVSLVTWFMHLYLFCPPISISFCIRTRELLLITLIESVQVFWEKDWESECKSRKIKPWPLTSGILKVTFYPFLWQFWSLKHQHQSFYHL